MNLPSERIIEDATEICKRLEIEPFTKSQLLVISLIIGHEVERLQTQCHTPTLHTKGTMSCEK